MTSEAFEWTGPRIQAALDVAEDQLTDEQIAEAAGVDRRTLARWKQIPEFAARVAELLDASYEACRAFGLASRQRRVQHLQERHDRLRLYLRSLKDFALIASDVLPELRALEEQAAREMGHRRQVIDMAVAAKPPPDLSVLTDAELAAYESLLAKCTKIGE